MSRGLLSNARLSALALCATGLLQACGGGGGGGGGGSSDSGGSSSSGASSGGVTPHGWVHESYLKAANADANDVFGGHLAISGDTLVVTSSDASNQTTITNGSTASSDNSAPYAGAVYVFKRTGATWTQQAYLKAPNADKNDGFGSVAIDGDTIVVGADGDDSGQTTITNDSTASTDNSATNAGSAYVFVRNGDTWTQQAYLKAHNSGHSDAFGASVGISGDTIVVGAYEEDSEQDYVSNGPTGGLDNPLYTSGAAYVFVRSGATWTEQAYLKASNNRADYYPRDFGISVAIDRDTVVVGAHGESSAQTTVTNGKTASDDRSAQNAGAAYVFVRSGVDWSQQAYLKAANAAMNSFFGTSVAISGDTIVVGADYDDGNQSTITNGPTATTDQSLSMSGAAYVYTRTANNWSQQAYLKASNAGMSDGFGNAVAISGDTIVVGAFSEGSNQTTITNGSTASSDNSAGVSGAAYVFKRTAGLWAQTAYIKAPNTQDETDDSPGDQFGHSVAIDGDTIAVGAIYEDSNQRTISNGTTASTDNSVTNAGAAYAFRYYP